MVVAGGARSNGGEHAGGGEGRLEASGRRGHVGGGGRASVGGDRGGPVGGGIEGPVGGGRGGGARNEAWSCHAKTRGFDQNWYREVAGFD